MFHMMRYFVAESPWKSQCRWYTSQLLYTTGNTRRTLLAIFLSFSGEKIRLFVVVLKENLKTLYRKTRCDMMIAYWSCIHLADCLAGMAGYSLKIDQSIGGMFMSKIHIVAHQSLTIDVDKIGTYDTVHINVPCGFNVKDITLPQVFFILSPMILEF